MTIGAFVESTGAQSMRTATRSTKYEWQRRATRSTAGVETLETPLATRTSTSQCKRRSRTTHRTQQDESSEIQSSGWPGKKSIRPQTPRKNGVARPSPAVTNPPSNDVRAQQSSGDSLQSAPRAYAALPPDHERGRDVQNTDDQTGSEDCVKRFGFFHAIVAELTQESRKSGSKKQSRRQWTS